MKRWPELLPNAIGIVIALLATCLIVGVLLRSGDAVPWQLWGAIAFGLTFCATLIVSVWWYDRWKGKR